MFIEHELPRAVRDAEELTERFEAFQWLSRAAGALDRSAAECLADLELSAGSFNALIEVAAAGDEGIAPSELARKLYIARRTATLYIDILVRNGWATRHGHPDDKRMVLASLSPEGVAVLEQCEHECRKRLASLMAPLSADQSVALTDIMKDLLSCDVEQGTDD